MIQLAHDNGAEMNSWQQVINFQSKRINCAHFLNDYYHLKRNSTTQT